MAGASGRHSKAFFPMPLGGGGLGIIVADSVASSPNTVNSENKFLELHHGFLLLAIAVVAYATGTEEGV